MVLDNVFLQMSILLAITVSIAFVMRLLRQPLLVGYLIAGIVAGPFVLNLLAGDEHLFHALSEFGVVLLLFMVGLSLNFTHIKKIGKVSLIAGLSQVAFTSVIGFLVLYFLLQQSLVSAIYLAVGITFSSTIIIAKLLADKKDTESVYGRYTIGLMIVQDVVALCIIIVLTSFTEGETWSHMLSVLSVKILMLIAFVYALARYVVPRILSSVAKSTEFLFVFTVAWCFCVASLLFWLGFSIEVGALIAGLTLGSSPYQAEISSRVKPLRDFFLVLFFIILGSQLSLSQLEFAWIPGVFLSVFILLGNPFILFWVFRSLKFTRRNSFLAGVTAAQVSEFGFVLLLSGEKLGHITGNEMEIFTIVALATIIISSYLITYNESIYSGLRPVFDIFGKDKRRQKEEPIPNYDVWIFGYHRLGVVLGNAFTEKKVPFAVVDFNPTTIQKLEKQRISAYFGDAADVEFLEQLQFEKTKMIFSTIPSVDDQKTLIAQVRNTSKKIWIITTAHQVDDVKELYDAGSDYVFMPHMVGAAWMGHVLQEKRWTKSLFASLSKEQKKELEHRSSAGV
jgi:Kef-type K+ transport system membrane component KefB